MGVVCTENVPFFRDFMITMEQKKSPGCFSLPPENFSEDFYATINFHQGRIIDQSNFNFVFFEATKWQAGRQYTFHHHGDHSILAILREIQYGKT